MADADNIEPDPEGPYCIECGNDDRRRLGAIHSPAGAEGYSCTVYRCDCGHEFSHSRRREDD